MVGGQPSLQQVLERVNEWMAKEGLLDPNIKSIFVTCGDWDLSHAPRTGPVLGLASSDYFKQWVNLKKAYSFAMGCWPKNGLLDMNKGLSLQHIGRLHSGTGQSLHMSPWQLVQSPAHTPQSPGTQRGSGAHSVLQQGALSSWGEWGRRGGVRGGESVT